MLYVMLSVSSDNITLDICTVSLHCEFYCVQHFAEFLSTTIFQFQVKLVEISPENWFHGMTISKSRWWSIQPSSFL